jgi:hypothetical protein
MKSVLSRRGVRLDKSDYRRIRSGGKSVGRAGRRLAVLESVERRLLFSTFSVINAHDSGPGSLRFAIEQANLPTNPGPPLSSRRPLAGRSISPAASCSSPRA